MLYGKDYNKIAFYTADGYTAYVLDEYKRYFGTPDFDVVLVDSNDQKYGQKLGEYMIYAPTDLLKLCPDCIVISNYNFDEEIYQDLTSKYPTLNVAKLHEVGDVPWVF